MYEIWAHNGLNEFYYGETYTLECAIIMVEKSNLEYKFSIKKPDGTWHQWFNRWNK